MTYPPDPTPPPPPNWWHRNWKWAVPVGCVLPVLICGGIITAILALVFGTIKASEPYNHALQAAGANARVAAILGGSPNPGTFPSGSINLNNDAGNADLSIPVSGPKGSGTIHVIATKSAGAWKYKTVTFQPAGSKEQIDITGGPYNNSP
jgi:cytochrome oxidase complex assembly protein 1